MPKGHLYQSVGFDDDAEVLCRFRETLPSPRRASALKSLSPASAEHDTEVAEAGLAGCSCVISPTL